jgi:hypothetical protein
MLLSLGYTESEYPSRPLLISIFSKICAGTSNPKAAGRCNTPNNPKLWAVPTNATDEAEALANLRTWSLQDVVGSISDVDIAMAAEDCTGADVPEKGHKTSGFAKSYNTDAFYTKAAACYIFKKMKSAGS